jgi:serine phosphatase RsbU (regulator of sigma subunit)
MKRFITAFFLLLLFKSFSQTKNRVVDSIQNLINTAPDIHTKLYEQAALVVRYHIAGDSKSAEKLFKETEIEAEKSGSQKGMAAVYNTKGILFYYASKFDSALPYFEKSLVIRRKIKDDKGILKTTSNVGSIYYMMGNYKKALGYFEEALKKESALKYDEGSQVSINNIGSIYSTLKMHDRALYYFRKAEKIYSKNNELEHLAYSYDGLHNVYKDLAHVKLDSTLFDTAMYYARKSKDVAMATHDKNAVCYAIHNIATVYKDQKKYDLARQAFMESLVMCRELQDQRLELGIYANLAANEVERNRPDSALQYIEKLIPLQEQLQNKTAEEGLTKLYAEYYYQKKEFQKAYDYLKKYDGFTDSIYNLETTRQINEIQTKYESEKKESENLLLQSENKSFKATRNYLLIILAIALIGIVGAFIAYRKIKNSKELVSQQKHLVEEKQKEILDSINYAKRIQFALLASDGLLQTHLHEHFVLFLPKDVVSGDFYWATPTPQGFIYITADCTGHGVPGAFMSLLNISKLSQTINENKITRPDVILNNLRAEIIKVLNPEGSEESKDGMDAVLCKLDLKKMKLEYAAANNSFYIVRDNKLLTCKADKMPVGKGHDDTIPFSYSEIALQKGDVIYTFTDGFADQFGGPLGKKYKYKQMEEVLLSIHNEPMPAQKQKLTDAFISWKGKLEQIDDVCLIGVRI